jgi:hypothetical protein
MMQAEDLDRLRGKTFATKPLSFLLFPQSPHYSNIPNYCEQELLSPNKDIVTIKEPLSPNFMDSVNEGFLNETNSTLNSGLWTNEEHQRFLKFWEVHERGAFKIPNVCLELASKKIRKRRKKLYFSKMAEFIKTRNPGQCRSHQQKYCAYLKRSQLVVECKPFKLREDHIDSRERKSLKNWTSEPEGECNSEGGRNKFLDKNSSAPSQSKMFLQDLILDCEIFNLRASSMNVL